MKHLIAFLFVLIVALPALAARTWTAVTVNTDLTNANCTQDTAGTEPRFYYAGSSTITFDLPDTAIDVVDVGDTCILANTGTGKIIIDPAGSVDCTPGSACHTILGHHGALTAPAPGENICTVVGPGQTITLEYTGINNEWIIAAWYANLGKGCS